VNFAHSTAEYVALTTVLAIVTGVVALVAGILRLGFLASLISEPVLRGSSSAWR
jgi:SulP family sulfate permease